MVKNLLIVEDEKPAIDRLVDMLDDFHHEVRIAGIAMSVRQAVNWLGRNPMPDLILMDISLTDGSSFDIFDKTNITCPVIFITAYNEFWQEAFEHHGIDYLLKPLKKEKLAAALKRFDALREHFQTRKNALIAYTVEQHPYRKRFLVRRGKDLFSIRTEDIACFFAADKVVFLVDNQGQRFVMDQSLKEIEKELDPAAFLRVNRKFIFQKNAILRAKSYSKSKLLLDTQPAMTEQVIISQENAAAFKDWFGS